MIRERRAEASRALPGVRVSLRRRRVARLRTAALGLLLSLGLSACTDAPQPFNATEVSGIDYGHTVAIPDTRGTPRRLKEFTGRVTVVFFGFTSCPDICPTTLWRLKQVRDALGTEADRLQILLVSVDPERDTAERLRAYVEPFGPGFVGLRPEPQDLATVVRAFHAIAEKVPLNDGADYTIDHSSTLYVYDMGARLRLISQADIEPTALASDLRRLIAEAS